MTGARGYGAFFVPPLALLIALHVVPVGIVLLLSVTEPRLGLQNYERLLTSVAAQKALVTTLRVCLITTVITVVLGLVYALIAVRAHPLVRQGMMVAVVLTFWLSALIRTVAWVTILRDNGLINTLLLDLKLIAQPLPLVRNEVGVIIGMVHYMFPLAVLPIYSSLSSIPERQEHAAVSLGAGPWRTLLQIILPQCKPGLVAATAIVFIFSLGFLVTPAILGGGKVIMVAEYIKLQFDETVRWGIASMMATTLLVAVVVALLIVSRIMRLQDVFGAK